MHHGHLTFPALSILNNIPGTWNSTGVPKTAHCHVVPVQVVKNDSQGPASCLHAPRATCQITHCGCSYPTTLHCSPSTLPAQQHPGAHLSSPSSSSCVSVTLVIWSTKWRKLWLKTDFTVSINPNHGPWCTEVEEGRKESSSQTILLRQDLYKWVGSRDELKSFPFRSAGHPAPLLRSSSSGIPFHWS